MQARFRRCVCVRESGRGRARAIARAIVACVRARRACECDVAPGSSRRGANVFGPQLQKETEHRASASASAPATAPAPAPAPASAPALAPASDFTSKPPSAAPAPGAARTLCA
eukprot:6183348-Pleurochrysis_carterae.AAC.3